MKFKKIAIIGKYPSSGENKDIHNQLIQLIAHLNKKNIDLVIEEKTQKKIKLKESIRKEVRNKINELLKIK